MAFSYAAIEKCIYTANHNTSNQQLTSKLSFSNNYRWPFKPPSIKKPQTQKVRHPKQSTFRVILPLFAVMETRTQNLQWSVWQNIGPPNRPQKISQHVGLQRWINGIWKKRRETSISLTGRQLNAAHCTVRSYETS